VKFQVARFKFKTSVDIVFSLFIPQSLVRDYRKQREEKYNILTDKQVTIGKRYLLLAYTYPRILLQQSV